MAIQFQCSGCSQPIEVDDDFAGQQATCPYCRHVVTVPDASTYGPDQAVEARPAGDEPTPPAPPQRDTLDGAPPAAPFPPSDPFAATQRRQVADAYGRYALICAGIVVALLIISAVASMPMMAELMPAPGEPAPPMQEQFERVQNLPGSAWVSAAGCGIQFFGVVGLPLAIASLVQSRARSWQGWTGLAICGLAVLCIGLTYFIAMANGMMPAG
jgi:DNA-directed RNA polymerase subunit RPC12/RpoP